MTTEEIAAAGLLGAGGALGGARKVVKVRKEKKAADAASSLLSRARAVVSEHAVRFRWDEDRQRREVENLLRRGVK